MPHSYKKNYDAPCNDECTQSGRRKAGCNIDCEAWKVWKQKKKEEYRKMMQERAKETIPSNFRKDTGIRSKKNLLRSQQSRLKRK